MKPQQVERNKIFELPPPFGLDLYRFVLRFLGFREVFVVECLHECRFGASKKLALGQQKTQPVNEAHEIIRNYNPPQPPRMGQGYFPTGFAISCAIFMLVEN